MSISLDIRQHINGFIAQNYSKLKPSQLLLPALLMILLGSGNIFVGQRKINEYGTRLKTLPQLSAGTKLNRLPPLARLELMRDKRAQLYQERFKAEQRTEYYQLVAFGGKVFISIGFFLIFLTLAINTPHLRP